MKKILIVKCVEEEVDRVVGWLVRNGCGVQEHTNAIQTTIVSGATSVEQAKQMAKAALQERRAPEPLPPKLNKDGKPRGPKIKKVGGKGIYENFQDWIGETRDSFRFSQMQHWFNGLQDGDRRFNPHSLSTLKHELRTSGLMTGTDEKLCVDPVAIQCTSGMEMRTMVERNRLQKRIDQAANEREHLQV